MLRSVNLLQGHQLISLDGEIGHVKDFYFDDLHWAIRYLVTDTGSWLSDRQVLIPPHVFGLLDHTGKRLQVHLTKRQIEDSPVIGTDKPVSRQNEIDFYRHYGLNYYWQGIGVWGMSGYPVIELPPAGTSGLSAADQTTPRVDDDPHLRSTNAVKGYGIQASDGEIGQVADFLMDDRSWVIDQLVVKTGGWFSGREVKIPTSDVESISYEKSTVRVRQTVETIKNSPGYQTTSGTGSGT
jgi:uncharacterized protein YrrD